jgi:hopanoid biosynthesis associated protein HpnK
LRRLVVTADDFGAAHEVNDAVEAAHRDGILSAASLMIAAPAAADAIARARRMPTLRVGLHLVLVEGRPLLPARAVTHLVDREGQFRTDLAALAAVLAVSGQARRQLAAEISAQFEAYQASGLPLDHCNAHKHYHLHPVVGRVLLAVGARFGLRAVRVPLEPARVLRAIEPHTGSAAALLSAPCAYLLRRRVRAAGMLAADQVFGLRWSGRMSTPRLAHLIAKLPHGLTEIYLHPATGRYAGDAPGYQYREELAALMAPEVLAAARNPSLQRGGFCDFLPAQPSAPSPIAGAL